MSLERTDSEKERERVWFCDQVVREHYLRDDIPCGALFCSTCDTSRAKLRDSAPNILVVDTNVVLHQVFQSASLVSERSRSTHCVLC